MPKLYEIGVLKENWHVNCKLFRDTSTLRGTSDVGFPSWLLVIYADAGILHQPD